MPKQITKRSLDGKTCTKCRAHKPYGEFSEHSKSSDGRQSHCKPCVARSHRAKKVGRPCQRCKNPQPHDAVPWAKYCKQCRSLCTECGELPRQKGRRRCRGCSERFLRDQYARRPADVMRSRVGRAMRVYGVSREEALRLISIRICEACGREMSRPGEMHIDHDHMTGEVRGVLCFNCNAALGHLKDSRERLEMLICYLGRDRDGI